MIARGSTLRHPDAFPDARGALVQQVPSPVPYYPQRRLGAPAEERYDVFPDARGPPVQQFFISMPPAPPLGRPRNAPADYYESIPPLDLWSMFRDVYRR